MAKTKKPAHKTAHKTPLHKRKVVGGFTLVEILVVVALIAILAAITIIAINPAKNFADARNTTRSSDVTTILNAVTQYTSEVGNQLTDLGTIPLCSATPATIGSGAGNLDLGATLVPEFVVAIPQDPQSGTPENTGYRICLTASNRVQVDAPSAENSKTILVSR